MSAFASRCLVAFILVQLISVQSFAKGGGRFGRGDDRYNRDNIESLPPEIRNVIFHLCGKPMALHTFASYADNLSGSCCTSNIFTAKRATIVVARPDACIKFMFPQTGHFRLLRSYYAPTGDLNNAAWDRRIESDWNRATLPRLLLLLALLWTESARAHGIAGNRPGPQANCTGP